MEVVATKIEEVYREQYKTAMQVRQIRQMRVEIERTFIERG